MKALARLAALASMFIAGAVQAHSPWLLPSSTVLSKPDWVSFDGAVSTRMFDVDHFPLNTDGLVVTAPDGSAAQPDNLQRGKLRTVFDLNLTQPGTWRVSVLSQGVFASYQDAAGQPRRWRGTRETMATGIPADARALQVTETAGRVETFVTVGKTSPVRPVGQGLELTPVTHPNDLAKGETATFVLLHDGRPAAGVEVTATLGGMRYRDQVGAIKAVTDTAGRFSLRWPEAGMYYLEARTQDGKTSVPQAKERRLSYAATLEVLP